MIRICARGTEHDTEMCEPNLNILAHAQAIELEIGSRCGGHGVCGGDRIQIPAEDRGRFSAITDPEREHLTTEELALGWRLACQCYPESRDLNSLLTIGS